MTAAQQGDQGTSFPCGNCGAKLSYDAASQSMACPYCGFKQAVPKAAPAPAAQGGNVFAAPAGTVRSIPLAEGLRMAARGYGAPVTMLKCNDCGANVNVGEGERTTTCAFCGSKQVLVAEATEQPIRPESLLPFKVSKEEANKRFGDWLHSLWFRPNDLKKIAKVNEMGGVYVPFWTFDSEVSSYWTADRGWHYYETESYTEIVNGQRVHRERQVQRTRWEPASGSRYDQFFDVLVCAGRTLPTELVDKLSTFDTKQLVPYQPHFLAGWRAEAYGVELEPAFGIAQQKMASVQQGRCAGDIGGDTHRALQVENQYQNPKFKHVLLPVWVAAYRYHSKVYRFVVNGQSGEIVGVAPWSVWKIALLVIGILVVIGTIIAIYANQQSANGPPPSVTAVPAETAPALPTATASTPPAPSGATTGTAHTHPIAPAPSGSHAAPHGSGGHPAPHSSAH